MTGEDWTAILFDLYQNELWLGGTCLLLWFIFSSFILLQIFSAVLLERFALNFEDRIALQVIIYKGSRERALAKERVSDEDLREWQQAQLLRHKQSIVGEEDSQELLTEEEQNVLAGGANFSDREEEARQSELASQYAGGEALDHAPAAFESPTRAQSAQAAAMKGGARLDAKLGKASEDKGVAGVAGRVETVTRENGATKPKASKASRKQSAEAEDNVRIGIADLVEDVAHGRQLARDAEGDGDLGTLDASLAEVTCFVFGRDSQIRIACYQLCKSSVFEWGIVAVIFLSSALLCLESPYYMDQSTKDLVAVTDPIFLALFCLEMCLKITAFGLTNQGTGYLDDVWNRLDGCAVVLSLVALTGLIPA